MKLLRAERILSNGLLYLIMFMISTVDVLHDIENFRGDVAAHLQ